MVEIKNENYNEFKIGDKVWWYDSWGIIQNGKISEFKGEYAGIKMGVHGGISTGAKLSECWPTKEACQNAEERRATAQKTEYIESIKDVNDLVQFLFDHDVSGEDHNYEAEAAARERAKDLLGLVIK